MLTDSGLAGKAVIVTGGSRGIGRAIVEIFSAEGADVTFLFRENTAAAAEVIATGRAAGRPITAEQVDVRDAHGCTEAVERVAERCGRIDVLVNNAGLVRDSLLGHLGEDDVRMVLETNVGGVFNVTRAVAVELAPRRITVNAVAPGVIETDMSQAIRDRNGEEVQSRILLRRFGTAAEVAYAVWFLASRFADYITGEVLHVDGGFKME